MQECVLGKHTVTQVEMTNRGCTGENQCLKIHLEADLAIH